MPRFNAMNRRYFLLFALVPMLVLQPGCGFMSHMMYWVKGNNVEAKFTGLNKKTVAIVCFDSNLSGPGNVADSLARAVGTKLAMNVPKVKVVDHQKVTDWIDEQTENVTDFKDVGTGVKAEMVIGIDLDTFSTHDGPTLLRGRARVKVTVYDLTKNGEVVYQTPPQDVIFPENGPRPVTENESAFRAVFIEVLSTRCAKDFYAYDRMLDFGTDTLYSVN